MASSRNKFFSGGKLSNKSSSSSGLRILWIPGRHKHHSKGRFDSTNKEVINKSGSKKNEIWSLGGTKNQRDLVDADPDSTVFDGPSVSGVTSAACTLGAVSVEKCNITTKTTTTPTITISAIGEDNANADSNTNNVTVYNTPSSTASTTPLIPNSPDTGATPKIIITTTSITDTTESKNSNEINMPAKTSLTTKTTTTAEIMDENRFSILGNDISDELDVYNLPTPPKNGLNTPTHGGSTNGMLNVSAGTTASTATTPSPSHTPKQSSNERDSMAGSLSKKKNHHKHENNNPQNDINSIESISDNPKLPSSDLEWIDDLLLDRNSREMLNKKKKKKKISTTKELDQLDGVPSKHNTKDEIDDENEKVVKCLYYTLMCCECTIS